MHVGDAASWATIIGAAVPALALLVGLVTSFVKARSGNQRGLRDRLRQQLRQMDLACYVYFKREGWEAVKPPPQYSFHALEQIHQDGLLSPNRAHIERIKKMLREIRDSQTAMFARPTDSIFSEPSPDQQARLHRAFEDLNSMTQAYLRALGKMDNTGVGGYWTYLRYRVTPVWRRQ